MHSSRTDSRMAVVGLVLANLVPLVGVVGFGWTLHSILVIYWLESGVLGAAYVAKIRRAEGEDDPDELPEWEFSGFGESETKSLADLVGTSNRRIVSQFVRYYLVFWLFHGVFVLYGLPNEYPSLEVASPSVVAVAAVGFTVSHAVSYRINYLGAREYERNGPVALMGEPLHRSFVLHVTIVFAGIPIELAGSPAGAVGLLVVLKTYFDLEAHRREHERAQRPPSTSSAS
ncbi:DUF6498-containing protein [Natronoglomus mannanivorans]|uniref:DUF6498-containing protein n=1 Tax=Natronoglomus mannanivorans TaxID=2979990 RepID=A0AAP3E0I7_9EURY|nr:DUF6498-containing protein [Halobacteria archaeon AArc-xg1-1]